MINDLERCRATAGGFAEYIANLKNEKDYVFIAEQKVLYAQSIRISIEEFNRRLKESKSEFMYDTVGFSDGAPVTRFNLIYLFKKTILKMIKRIECENREPLTLDEKRFIMDQLELKLNGCI